MNIEGIFDQAICIMGYKGSHFVNAKLTFNNYINGRGNNSEQRID